MWSWRKCIKNMSTISLSWQFEKCNKDEDQKNFAGKDFRIFEFAKEKFPDILQYNLGLQLYMPTATLISLIMEVHVRKH